MLESWVIEELAPLFTWTPEPLNVFMFPSEYEQHIFDDEGTAEAE